jgi:hypothetical protein
MTPRAPFELSIGSLVLEGFGHGGRHDCAGAFTREFERLVRRRGLPGPFAGGATEWRIPPLSITAKTDDPPALVGRALARSLFEALHCAAEDS